MRAIDATLLRSFLRDQIEPIPDSIYGPGYRAEVVLLDGTILPCVIFRSAEPLVNLAIRRFKEEQGGKSIFARGSGRGYRDIVKTFVASGNCINDYDISEVRKSRFAIPMSLLKTLQGETTMSWTSFAGKHKDGRHIGFGTSFRADFFSLPDGVDFEDLVEIINHSYVLKSGELRSHTVPFMTPPDDYSEAVVFRERPSFECFLDNF